MEWNTSPPSARPARKWTAEEMHYLPLEAGSLQGGSAGDRSKDLRCRRCFGGFHLSRGKYGCLLVSLCGVLTTIMLLIAIFAIVPSILRSQLRHSTLGFGRMVIRGVPSEAEGVQTEATVNIGNIISMAQAKVAEAPLTLSFVPSANGSSQSPAPEPFGELTLPVLQLHGSTSIFLNETLRLSSLATFERFTRAVLMADTVELLVQGDLTVTPKLGAITLPTEHGISFDKTVMLTGCSGLRDIELVSFSLRSSTADQLRCEATIAINNPSAFGLHPIGQLQFDLYYAGAYQGSIHSLDAETRIDPGRNVLQVTGVLAPDPSHINATNELIVEYITGRGAWVEARAAANASSIPIYSRALQGLTAQAFMAGLPNGTLVAELELVSAFMTPSLTDSSVELALDLRMHIDSPLGPSAPIGVQSMRISSALVSFVSEAGASLPVGTVAMAAAVPVRQVGPFVYEASVSASMLVQHADNFQQFVRAFVQAPGVVGLGFDGLADVSVTYLYGTVPIVGLPIVNTIWMQGAGGLNQTDEKSLSLFGNRVVCAEQQEQAAAAGAVSDLKLCGVLLNMTASIFNPSLLTLNLSDSWFDLTWNGVRLGSVLIQPLFVAPGLNDDVFASGFLDPAQADLAVVSQFISEYVSGGNHTITIRGLTGDPSATAGAAAAANANAPPLTAHALVLGAIEAPATCHGIYVESLIGDMLIDAFSFDFGGAGEGPSFVLHSDALVEGVVTLPPSLSIPLQLQSSTAELDILFDVNGDGVLQSLASVSVPNIPISYKNGSDIDVLLPMDHAVVTVSAAQAAAFQAFGQAILMQSSANLSLQGVVSPVTATNMGVLSLSDVPVRHEVVLPGYNGFHAPDGTSLVHVLHLDIAGAVVDPSRAHPGPYLGGGGILLRCNVTLMNPSPLAITNLGLLEFDVYFQGVRIVTVSLANFTFHTGLNSYSDTCTGIVWSPRLQDPSDPVGLREMAVVQKFVSDYIDGFPNDFTMVGRILQEDGTYRSGCSAALLQPAFEQFATNLTVRGQPEPFIQSLTVYLTLESAAKIIADGGGIISACAQMYNPFGTSLTITNLNLTVLVGNLSGSVGGWLVPELGMQPIYIPPFGILTSEAMPVYLLWQPDVIAALFGILFGPAHEAPVSALGLMTVYVGAEGPGQPDPAKVFNQTLNPVQENVPARMANFTVTHNGDEAEAQNGDGDSSSSGGSPGQRQPLLTDDDATLTPAQVEAKRIVRDFIARYAPSAPALQQQQQQQQQSQQPQRPSEHVPSPDAAPSPSSHEPPRRVSSVPQR